jgi:tripartite ATP-independent transporter DctP family solute receptor
MWHAIERESGGRIHTQFFPNNQLGGNAAMLSQLRLGAIQFYLASPGNLAAVVPAVDICFLGFAYKDPDEAVRTMDGPLGTFLRRETAAKGLQALRSMWDSGMNQIGSNSHPIRTPDDLRGFKVRIAESKITVDLFKTLGASPTPLGQGEVYTALQTKVIDGETSPLVTLEAERFYEVNKYISMTNHQWIGEWLIVNADAWKNLPPDLQAILERNNAKYSTLERRDTRLANASLADKLSRQGIVINAVDPAAFRSRLRSYYESWAATFGATEWDLLQSGLGRRLT